MPSNPLSRIITPKTRRLSRRTCRVPVLPYQRQGRKLWTPGRGNKRLLFSLGELGERLLPENTGRRVRRSEEKQGGQKKVCHLNHRWGRVDEEGRTTVCCVSTFMQRRSGTGSEFFWSCADLGHWKLAGVWRRWGAFDLQYMLPSVLKGLLLEFVKTLSSVRVCRPFSAYSFSETRFTENRSATFVQVQLHYVEKSHSLSVVRIKRNSGGKLSFEIKHVPKLIYI